MPVCNLILKMNNSSHLKNNLDKQPQQLLNNVDGFLSSDGILPS